MKFESVSPIFSMADLHQSLDFYRNVLGFDVAWSWGDPPDIAAVCRDCVEITLIQRAEASPAGASHIYLRVSEIDAYYQSLMEAGANIIVPMRDRPYGMRDFRMTDPNGNELSIGQVIVGEGQG